MSLFAAVGYTLSAAKEAVRCTLLLTSDTLRIAIQIIQVADGCVRGTANLLDRPTDAFTTEETLRNQPSISMYGNMRTEYIPILVASRLALDIVRFNMYKFMWWLRRRQKGPQSLTEQATV